MVTTVHQAFFLQAIDKVITARTINLYGLFTCSRSGRVVKSAVRAPTTSRHPKTRNCGRFRCCGDGQRANTLGCGADCMEPLRAILP